MDESMQYLFFDCPYARFVWKVVHDSFNITHPLNMHHLFNGWMQGVDKKLKYKILVGRVCWENSGVMTGSCWPCMISLFSFNTKKILVEAIRMVENFGLSCMVENFGLSAIRIGRS
jgi:hypothetical protein